MLQVHTAILDPGCPLLLSPYVRFFLTLSPKTLQPRSLPFPRRMVRGTLVARVFGLQGFQGGLFQFGLRVSGFGRSVFRVADLFQGSGFPE